MTGTWMMKATSRDKLPAEHKTAVGQLVVNADGTFVAYELPSVVIPAFELPESVTAQPEDYKLGIRLCSGRGGWRVDRVGWETYHLLLNFRERICSDGDSRRPYGSSIAIDRGLSSCSLVIWLGDPDRGPGVWFKREARPTGP